MNIIEFTHSFILCFYFFCTNVLDNQYGFGAKRRYHICVDLFVSTFSLLIFGLNGHNVVSLNERPNMIVERSVNQFEGCKHASPPQVYRNRPLSPFEQIR